MFQSLKNKNLKRLSFIFFLILFIYSYITYEDPIAVEQENLEQCINSFSSIEKDFEDNFEKIYIIGHAYGSQTIDSNGLSVKVTDLFSSFATREKALVLTGDIVIENSIEKLSNVKNNIESSFENYFISPGSHDIGYSGFQTDNLVVNDNFIKIFSKDLFMQEFDNFTLIAANFSTPNWEPNNSTKKIINEYISKTQNEIIFLFSHQLFWLEDIDNVIKPNSWSMLKSDLKKDSLYWLDDNEKKLIVVSGDYGSKGEPPYCKQIENKVFIANGIHDLDNDSYLVVNFNKNKFYITIEKFLK